MSQTPLQIEQWRHRTRLGQLAMAKAAINSICSQIGYRLVAPNSFNWELNELEKEIKEAYEKFKEQNPPKYKSQTGRRKKR